MKRKKRQTCNVTFDPDVNPDADAGSGRRCADMDLFDRLGYRQAPELTPLRLAELEVSRARMREIEARRAGIDLATFTLTIKDIGAGSFFYEYSFDKPPDPELPMSLAQRLGVETAYWLVTYLGKALEAKGDEDGQRGDRPQRISVRRRNAPYLAASPDPVPPSLSRATVSSPRQS